MQKGLIIKSTGSRYKVLVDGKDVIQCSIKGKFRISGGIRTTNPVAAGDNVMIEVDTKTGEGIITEVLDRKNYILRKSSNLSKEFQIIASNLDRVFLMISLTMPATPMEFVDRFLVSAEAFRIPVSILINKVDLYDDDLMEKANDIVRIYKKIGYDCRLISLKEKTGYQDLYDLMKGKITLLSGNSGVGKSSFINILNPSLSVKTGEVSEYHKQGKHITTFPEMFEMPFGGYVIDSPGIRGFGLADMHKEEIYHFFPEIFKVSANCKFHNCIHIDEPGCAVLDAVESGEIEYSRYKSYFNMVMDENKKYR
ncbi:MAG: ribosome small subunit-dependent GTPase A [Bacteroidales bacterium]|nr:ribosome small subunit-dependent GTPase A [Bacteroidales bacterium]